MADCGCFFLPPATSRGELTALRNREQPRRVGSACAAIGMATERRAATRLKDSSRVDQHVAIGVATERRAATRLKRTLITCRSSRAPAARRRLRPSCRAASQPPARPSRLPGPEPGGVSMLPVGMAAENTQCSQPAQRTASLSRVGSACCYWNGCGAQCSHPAQGTHRPPPR